MTSIASPDAATDGEDPLWPRLHRGDPSAVEQLYQRQAESLRRYFRRHLPERRDEVDDYVHEVFERAVHTARRPDATPVAAVDNWLWGIARNVRNAWYESGSRDRERLTDQPLEDAAGGRGQEEPGFDSYGKREAIAAVHDVIDCLPPARQDLIRAFIALRAREGQTSSAGLVELLGAQWSTARVDRELNRVRGDIRQGLGVLAVAWAARDCAGAAAVRTAAGYRGPISYRDITAADRAALAAHADPGSCKACHLRFRNASQQGSWALGPGVLLLARYAESDADERHRALFALWSRRGPGAPAPAESVPLAPLAPVGTFADPLRLVRRVVERVRVVLRTVADRALASPRALTVVHALQQHVNLVRAGAALVTAAVVVGVVAAPHGSPGAAQAQLPPKPHLPHGTSTATDTPRPAPDPSTHVSPVGPEPVSPSTPADDPTPSPTDTGPPPTTTPAPTPAHPTATPTSTPTATTTRSTTTPTTVVTEPPPPRCPDPDGCPVEIDASGIAYGTVSVVGVTGPLDARSVQHVSLKPGDYTFQASGGTPIHFTVAQDGAVSTAAASYVTASGGQLRVTGLPVTVDATKLSLASFCLGHATARSWPSRVAQQLRLLPGSQRIGTGTTFVGFTVGPTGQISVDPTAGYLSGGAGTLVLTGLPVVVDATRMPATSFTLSGTGARTWSNSRPRQLRLLPGRHQFRSGGWHFDVILSPTGRFSFDPPGLLFVGGQGTAQLVVVPTA
jgi:DNA-directed RNA polymerase specialized sigma24 family protein